MSSPRTHHGTQAVQRASAIALISLAACATNPVSGKSELALVSESQEIEMGRQGAADVARSIGLYPDAALQAYTSRIGLSLAAVTQRPGLPWQFQVVDDPSVNAFALPGGFVFVTRGLLTHINNEAELATVLGHESGHVAARHSVQQMSRTQLAQLGLGVGSILSPAVAQYGGVAAAGLGLLFLKFSRSDESQADQLGFGYALTDGYDVRQMVPVFEMLDRQTALSGGTQLPEWESTHPNPGNRIAAIDKLLGTTTANLDVNKVGAEEFLQLTNGMVYGDNPRQGYFEGPLFLHPDLRFQFRFPDGWKTHNGAEAVTALNPGQDAVLELRTARGTAAEASQGFFAQQGLQAGTVSQVSVHGFPGLSGEFTAQTSDGAVRGIATFIEYGGETYQLTAYAIAAKYPGYGAAFRQSLGSFNRLTDPVALAMQPMRLRVERLPRAMTLAQFNAQYPSSISLDEVALINGLAATSQLRSGQSVKRVTKN
ncbi:MAG TPA: M48 family metalloprotease [Gemmatimonadales bacterium]|nr:M48 family metalloprotease [Gemmatimonadales bacterium]